MVGDTRRIIGVREAPDGSPTVGAAHCVDRDAGGVALWRLIIRGAELPGRWIVIDRQFRPAP
jgi:hypothetical protein